MRHYLGMRWAILRWQLWRKCVYLRLRAQVGYYRFLLEYWRIMVGYGLRRTDVRLLGLLAASWGLLMLALLVR